MSQSGYGYDQPILTPGEQQTGLTTAESEQNIDPSSPSYQGAHKKPSIFGKLKDKTKKAGSRIKSKVGKKKTTTNADGTTTTVDEEDDDENDSTSDDSPLPSPATPASPAAGAPATTTPREFGNYQSEPSRFATETPDVSSLSLNEKPDPSPEPTAFTAGSDQPPSSQKPSLWSERDSERDSGRDFGEKPVTERAGERASEVGNRGYEAATDATGAVQEKGSEVADRATETFTPDETPSTAGPKDAAYEAKDAAEAKAADVNDATGDQETYTQKTSNAAVAAKDAVAGAFNRGTPSEGPSTVDTAKGYLGSAVDTTKGYLGSATDTAKDQAGRTTDDSRSATDSAKDTTEDYATTAKDRTQDTTGSVADTTKDYATTGKDTTMDYGTRAKDTTMDYGTRAKDTTMDYATRAKETTADAATPKQEDKALSEKITDALGALPAKVTDTAAGVTESAKSPTTTTPTTITHAGAAHDAEAQPGILGKITGLFGYGQKAPEDHTHDPASATH